MSKRKTSVGGSVEIREEEGDSLVVLAHPDAPDDMRDVVAGRIVDGGFQPAPFAAWAVRPETLRIIADLIEERA